MNSDVAPPSALDRACSASCTKSGIAALLFSAFAMSLMQPLMRIDALQALDEYVSARLRLKTAYDLLASDTCWQALTAESGVAKLPMARLADRQCFIAEGGKLLTDTEAKARLSEASALALLAAPPPPPKEFVLFPKPAAPTNLMPGMGPLALDEVQRALVVLGQRETLRLATSLFQLRFGWSIYWWLRRATEFNCKTNPECKIDDSSYHFDQNLSVDDVKVLAEFELLNSTAVEQAILDESRITLPNARSAVTLGASSNLIEFGIVLSVFYFWLYQQEARESATYPAPGTLFGVFSRSRTSVAVFRLLVMVPAWCAGLVAFQSPTYVRTGNIALCLLVIMLCSLILRRTPPVTRRTKN
jgi:hypothetical protein